MKCWVLSLLLLPSLYGGDFSIRKEDLKPSGWDSPSAFVQKDEIAVYKSFKLYVFESQARQAAEKAVSEFKSFGISVLGYNTFEKDGDYGFSIEYLPLIKEPEKISSLLMKRYDHPINYWNRSLAQESADETEKYLRDSALKKIEIFLREENDYSFSMLYSMNNVLRKSSSYYVLIEKAELGDFTFESEAEKESQIYINRLKDYGFCAFVAYPVQKGDKWSVRVEYFSKTDPYKSLRPEYSLKTYYSPNLYPFEKNVLIEGRKLIGNLPPGVFAVSVYAMEKKGDWYFAIDYAVKNLYKKDKTAAEYEVKRYYSPQNFTFESEAKKAMEEKFSSFLENGLYPLDRFLLEKDGGYSFYLDYLSKNSESLK